MNVDIHCHLLPSVDDGAETVEVALDMARQAEQEGVTDIIVTPHSFHPRFDTKRLNVREETMKLQAILDDAGVQIRLHPGQEIRLFGELDDALRDGRALTLAGSRYVLVELPTDHVPAYTEALFHHLQAEGYIPVIAHPERNRGFVREPERLHRMITSGALSQVTAGSLVGRLGTATEQFALVLVERGLAQLLASDAHNVTTRAFHMNEAYRLVEERFGAEKSQQLQENAISILQNVEFYVDEPSIPRKNWRGKWK